MPLSNDLLKLSSREIQVIRMAAEGHCYKEIGRDLGISWRTVANHMASVLDKMKATSQANAVYKCMQAGIIA